MDALLGLFSSPANLLTGPTPTRRDHIVALSRQIGQGRATRMWGLKAHHVLDEMPLTDTFAWNTLIQSHLSAGELGHVLLTYKHMLLRGIQADHRTLPRVLSALSRLSSAHLSAAKQVHAQAVKLGFSSDHYVNTALIHVYGNLDSIQTAKKVLVLDNKSTLKSTQISWTLIIRLYLHKGFPGLAIDTLRQMIRSGAAIDSVAISTAISAASSMRSLKQGRYLHKMATDHGLDRDILVANSLLKMYIDCGSVKEARSTFDRMVERDLISWTEIIQAYVKSGEYNEALKLFRRMILGEEQQQQQQQQQQGLTLRPDPLSISTILPACARLTENKHGREIHGYLIRNRVESNLHVENALLDMYAKSGSIEYASTIFDRMKKKRDAISWTMMISGYSLHGQGDLGLDLFSKMERELGPTKRIDKTAYAAALHACVSSRSVESGKSIFSRITDPKLSHCILMVALLANSGLFNEAMKFVDERKIERNPEALRAILDGCRAHRNGKLGKQVTEMLREHEPLNADNYVMLSNWYAGDSKWDRVLDLKRTMGDIGLKPKRAFSWIEFRNKVHVFATGDLSHPRSERVYHELESLTKRIGEEGLDLELGADFSLHNVDEERECVGVGHSELLAISFGLISSRIGATVRVTKNHRVCRFCHEFAKGISVVTGREIVLKDPNRFHHFRGGVCSCQDFW